MDSIFKNIVIVSRYIVNRPVVDTEKTLAELTKYFQIKKIKATYFNISQVVETNLPNDCDLIVVVGGDGSLLDASHLAAWKNIPIVGINLGKLGFLADIAPNDLTQFDNLLKGKFYEERRFLLEVAINNKLADNDLALNEVAFLSCVPGRMINFSVSVNQQFLCEYHADGLIVATPTGSTAHALSGGGPILYPTLEAIALVPMLSHNLSSRPIVISSDSVIEIAFSDKTVVDLSLRCDGKVQNIPCGSAVKIKKSDKQLRLLHPLDYNYFETLRTKLHWEAK